MIQKLQEFLRGAGVWIIVLNMMIAVGGCVKVLSFHSLDADDADDADKL